MTKQQKLKELKEQIEKLEREIKEEQDKTLWLKIPEKNIEITTKQQFNNKTYTEILKEVKEEEIATYELLQELRNTEKYDFLKDFWVFVPNPDEISKKNNYVARFLADSDRAGFDCGRYDSGRVASLGVFLIKKIEVKK